MSLLSDGTPVTLALLVVVGLTSGLILYSKATKHSFGLFLDLFVDVFVFRHSGQLIFGGGLLYFLRLIERQLGPTKYAGYAAFVLIGSLVCKLLLRKLFHLQTASGPIPLIFANFVAFAVDVPPTACFSAMGWRCTDKAFYFLAGIHLLLLTDGRPVLPALSGLLLGMAYRWNFLGTRTVVVPLLIDSWLSKLLNPLLGGEATTRFAPLPPGFDRAGQSTTNRATRPQASTPAAQSASPSSAARAAPRAPHSQALSQLVSMGFDPAKAAQALQQTNNELESALTVLLN